MAYEKQPVSNGDVITADWGNYIQTQYDEAHEELESHKNDNVHKQRSATVIVATYNSKQSSKDGADYVCSQINAQEVINQAIQSIAETGGKVVLMEGTYNVSDSIVIQQDNTALEGLGSATIIKAMQNIEDSTGIIRLGGSEGHMFYNNSIRNLKITGQRDIGNCRGIEARWQTNCTISDCISENNSSPGIALYNSTNCTISNCISENNGSQGIALYDSTNCTISDCISAYNFSSGIFISRSSNNKIINNICTDNVYKDPQPFDNYGHIGMYVEDGQSSDNNYIVGNICRGQAHRGIAVRGSNNIVIHNDLRGSGTIELQDGGTNTITELAGNAISS